MKKAAPKQVRFHLRLFVADNESESRQAQDNLNSIIFKFMQDQFELKIVDVVEDYQTALDYNIFITPTLIVETKEESLTIIGNLSDTKKLLDMMMLTATR